MGVKKNTTAKKATGMIAVARDVTELKRAEEERLKATILKGPTIADAMIDGLIVTDLNGNIIFVNRAMDEYLVKNGVDAKELVGRSALDLPTVRPEDTEKFVELMKEVVEKGKAGPLEFQDVAGRWASITVSLLKDANGNPSALFAVRRDITELKRAEEERARAATDRARVEEIEKRIQKMRLIYEGSRKMALALELDEIYNRALELACTALEADGGSLMTFNEKTGELVVKVASGSQKETAIGKRLKLGERFAGHAAQRRKALFMHDVEDEPWFKSLKKFEEIKSGMSIPLLVKDKLVGVLNLKRTQRGEKFAKDDMGLVSILADYVASIIERKQAEEALRKSEASLAEAQRIAHMGNWDWDIVKNELRWSDEIYSIFGLKPQEFGSTYEAFLNSVHPDDREFVKKSVDEALYQRKQYSIDHRIFLPDASERIVHEQAEVFLDETGRPIRMVGTVQDITERKQAEEQTKRLREYLQLQVNRMPIGLIVWDKEFRVRTWNPAATKIFGFTEKEALEKHPYDLIVPKEVQTQVDDVWRRLLEGNLTAYSVNENITKDGRTIICDWANTPLKEADGTVIGVLSMVQDITERERAEKELKVRVKELEEFHELTVGRELKMKQMETELVRLRAKLGKKTIVN